MIITIDGPAGSGKSTIAKLVAQRLGYKYIDSGATYRALALSVKKNEIDSKSENEVVELSIKLELDFKEEKVILNGEDVTEQIRDEEIGNLASFCSTYKEVRINMVALQRKLAGIRNSDKSEGSHLPKNKKDSHLSVGQENIVCEGRDIGTVVFPNAELKFYIDASIKERATRRRKELLGKEISKRLIDIEKDIEERDLRDKTRTNSPLCVPKNANIIDTTNLNIEEEVEKVIEIIKSYRVVKQSSLTT